VVNIIDIARRMDRIGSKDTLM